MNLLHLARIADESAALRFHLINTRLDGDADESADGSTRKILLPRGMRVGRRYSDSSETTPTERIPSCHTKR